MSTRVARSFRDLPLAGKLTLLATATSAVPLLIACLVLAWYDNTRIREALITDTEILVDSLAANNTATLSFGDSRSATEMLRAAAVNPRIQIAALVTPDGKTFARYDRRPPASSAITALTPLHEARRSPQFAIDTATLASGRPQSRFTDTRLVVSRPVRLDGDMLGVAYVELSLDEMHARLVASRRVLAGALLVAAVLALLIGWRLQQWVSRPLLHLTAVTRAVARGRDYNLRAEKMSDDEVGELARGFNDMLEHIRQRDERLESHRQELEHTVNQRTAELQSSVDRYKLLVESTNAVPWEVASPTSTFSYISPQARGLFGYENHELTGKLTLLDLVHPDDRTRVHERLQQLADGGEDNQIDLDYRAVTAHGTMIDVRSAVAALQHADASERVLRGITVDMTQQKKLEMELRQAQKLESVGRLAAGVAHEINTPVQFVSDSVHFLQEGMEGLSRLIREYRALHTSIDDGAPDPRTIRAAAELIEEIDLDYLLDNMPKALDRSLEGLKRVAVIVRSMKEFAHPDQKEMSAANLNQAIMSTLTIARNEYKYVADVKTEFAELPLVRCHLGDVNQVILNLIVNAAHAIEEAIHGTSAKGLITIRTRATDATVVIEVSDSGKGIPESIRERIFDPFFTTKGVGKGTGQGLAIARSVIVEKHGGSLTFQTRVGRGTTFTIELPLNGSSRPMAA